MADGIASQISAVRSLDLAAVFQQSVLAADLAARQRERELAVERARGQDQVEQASPSSASQPADMDLSRRETAAGEGLARRYKVVWKRGGGTAAQWESPGPGPGSRIDVVS